MRLYPIYSSNQQGGLGDSRTAFCLLTHDIRHSSFSLASCLSALCTFWGKAKPKALLF